jgi:hypothetical protein
MAGSRRPGSWGSEGDDRIDPGTSCLARTPVPGASLDIPGPRVPSVSTPTTSPQPQERKQSTPSTLSTSSGVRDLVVTLIGPQTFGIGVTVGVAENVARSIVDLAGLARTFLLADLYDRANGPAALSMIGPLGFLQYGAAEFAMWQFGDELKQARADRDSLIAEVVYAIKNPGEVFGNITADYGGKWRRFEAHSAAGTLTGRFEAGRIFGDVLVDVVSLIGTGVAAAKLASKVPRLAQMARSGRLIAAGGGGGGGAAKVTSKAVTPSQLAKTHGPPTIVTPPKRPTPNKKTRKKSLRERYMGKTPGKNSKTGQAVIDRMNAQGKITYDDITGETLFQASDRQWYPLRQADMSHKVDAVKWWNRVGRKSGAQSAKVREFMLDPDNYTLDYYKFNRSAGAKLGVGYKPPVK